MLISEKPKLIIFFDGTCGLCHRFVHFALCTMKGEPFLFAPQDSDLFRNIPHRSSRPPDSIVVYLKEETQLFIKGDAVRLIFLHLKYPWRIAAYVIYLIPKFMLDFAYDIIAKYRHNFLKRHDRACPIIPPIWRKFFVD